MYLMIRISDLGRQSKWSGHMVSHSDAQSAMTKLWALMSWQKLTIARCLDLSWQYKHLNRSLIESE